MVENRRAVSGIWTAVAECHAFRVELHAEHLAIFVYDTLNDPILTDTSGQ